MKEAKEYDEYLESCGISVHDLSKLYYFSTNMSPELTKALITETDEILKDFNSKDYSPSLAGKIYDGKQILIEPALYGEKPIAELIHNLESMAFAYVSRFIKKAVKFRDAAEEYKFKCKINDMWIVSQEAHDYNPPHNHRTTAPTGLSGVLYLKVPSQISESKKDGWFHFSWGSDISSDLGRLTFADHLDILPKKSMVLMFPKNMCHEVFPFRGEGERRCIAFNINVFSENKRE